MRCTDPYCTGGLAFPCGRCQPCLFARKGVWSHRIILEAQCHAASSFVTLTYDEEHVPVALEPGVASGWIKRLRSRGHKFRYFLCGEYGAKSGRPHYHAVIFGQCAFDNKFVSDVSDCWRRGFVSVAELTETRAAYTAGYVLKKLGGDASRTFQRMSLRPYGLGARSPMLGDLVKKYQSYLEEFPDVLPYVHEGGRARPLGRYITETIRREVLGDGYLSPKAKEFRQVKRLERLRKSLQDVYTCAGYVAKAEGSSVRSVVRRAIHQENLQGAVNQAARSKRNETV